MNIIHFTPFLLMQMNRFNNFIQVFLYMENGYRYIYENYSGIK
jgi:hypothetical protein